MKVFTQLSFNDDKNTTVFITIAEILILSSLVLNTFSQHFLLTRQYLLLPLIYCESIDAMTVWSFTSVGVN